MWRKLLQIICLLLLFGTITGCLKQRSPAIVTPDVSLYTVDSVFREFYNLLGGQEVLGEAISPVQEKDGITYQYTEAALLIFDPQADAKRLFQLAPLGKEIVPPDSIVEGEVANIFEELYYKINGPLFAGKPLTDLIYHEEYNRSEQYFENVGFYSGPETNGTARMLPLGAWRCDETCRINPQQNAMPLMPVPTHSPSVTPQPSPQASPQPSPVVATHQWILQVWETAAGVSGAGQVEIGVIIQRDGAPAAGIQANLLVELPNDTTDQASFPPTDSDGVARIKVNSIDTANGTIIPYQVCIANEFDEVFCVRDNFITWNSN